MTAMMESVNGNLRESNNDGFEVIYKVKFYFFNDFIYMIEF